MTLTSRPRRGRRRRPAPTGDDDELLDRLRAGDERAFMVLVTRHHESMVRLASTFVPAAAAEEVVQDTWMVVVRGIDRFEGRSSLRTWLMRILVNRARTTGAKERRTSPSADLERAVDPSRFDHNGAWSLPPVPWVEQADDRLAADAVGPMMRSALHGLPTMQRQVVSLRDVDGLSSREVCEVLDISEGNQRVLLHRGRSRLRQALETELGEGVTMAIGRQTYACQEMVELVTDYLEGALGRRARRRFEAHLTGCEHCTEYVAQLRATIRVTGAISADDFTAEMRDEFVELYQRWRQEPA